AVRVVARCLGNCFLCGCERDGAFEVRAQFAVPDKIKWLRGEGNAVAREAGNLFEPAVFEHCLDAPCDAVVQRGARRLQADSDGGISLQALAARLMYFSKRAPG